jgi:hypothetical protein
MGDLQRGSFMRRYVVRFGGEAILIVVSVFVAILLESMWQDRTEEKEARESLAQVRLSLLEDKEFFDRVEKEQRIAAEQTQLLIQWFSDPETLPKEQVHEVFLSYTMPISIWPRRAAWSTMVSAGQLQLLDAPGLTTKIGDYYEHHLRRIEYNGRQYDDSFSAVAEGELPHIWDFGNQQLLTTDPIRLTKFRNRLLRVSDWIDYYLESVDRNRRLAEELVVEIDQYLR